MSVRGRVFAGSGRIALPSSWEVVASTDSSPLRLATTRPSKPIQSPMSMSPTSANAASPISAREAMICTKPLSSFSRMKTRPPWSRLSITRPATWTTVSVSAPASSDPNSSRISRSVWSRGYVTGYGSMPRRRSASTLARRAWRWAAALPVSPWGAAGGSAGVAPSGICSSEPDSRRGTILAVPGERNALLGGP